ncbi:sigma factor-binding protein Crl [Leminorella grimontii]|nr:sigma factor-binding protein Crl [Leminorella grimontii]VFS60490.1 Curlin genes transcriptional activatory protein [Leminorella grimontii]
MLLPNGHSRSRLMKEFVSLGPYIREAQSKGHRYFFDCLAVCVSSKPAPEKREFWGWWMELEADEQGFTYRCQVGLYDKAGDWQAKAIKDAAVMSEIDSNLKVFQQRLNDYLSSLNLTLRPAER